MFTKYGTSLNVGTLFRKLFGYRMIQSSGIIFKRDVWEINWSQIKFFLQTNLTFRVTTHLYEGALYYRD
jgi:hypothetical protein